MFDLTQAYIRDSVADSGVIYKRGVGIYKHGAYMCSEADAEAGRFVYDIDGNYGDYTTRVTLLENGVETFCDCPYPGAGCKHTVAALLDIHDRLGLWKSTRTATVGAMTPPEEKYLTREEIRAQALEDRRKRAQTETFVPTLGDMCKGEHLVETPRGRQYTVTMHDPENERGHCTCPDFLTNELGTCKHMIFVARELKKKKDFKTRIEKERFPFADIFWDSATTLPRLFNERPASEIGDIARVLSEYFNADGSFAKTDLTELMGLLPRLSDNKRVRVQECVIGKLDSLLADRQLMALSEKKFPETDIVNVRLYPYQEKGIAFALYKKAALIGDEMGLGKTLQAIVLAILKKDVFGFSRVLVVTMASLKEQWKREIERFSKEKGALIAGNQVKRQAIYEEDDSLFKITNYEAVLRDVGVISRYKPDLVILDEAQRIKNFNTKTADAVKSLPFKHALVLTGTPLENKLEDVYSIVQFLDPDRLAPLWKFAADHFMLSREKKGKIVGYRNLDILREKLAPLVIRRRKEEVLSDLPDEVTNTYYLEMHERQAKIHAGYLLSLFPLLNKKFLTPMDLRRIQELLMCMRRVCDSTYLVDRETHISPKLEELAGIIDELVVQNGRKTVIFSEWTTMTFLIGKHLSSVGIPFVELSGRIPVHKRQLLIDEFTNNPDCKVFLSTEAGGSGLNLQAADCVINFELPWNPAKMNQRIGRVSRIGQKSTCINIVNLVMKNSIEEKILAGIRLKTDLFKGVFEDGDDTVEFSHEKRMEMLNRLREMMGEEPDAVISETTPAEEIPEDTPHYLNPEVLRDEDERVAYDAEEAVESAGTTKETSPDTDKENSGETGNIFRGQPAEKIETVLNSGMQFIGGLLEMATGKKIETSATDDKMIRIDRETGEVTMKFRLPGF